jgi:hypothetical protein
MVAVNGQLAVVALDVVAVGFHQVAIWISEIPLGFGWLTDTSQPCDSRDSQQQRVSGR